MAVIWRKRGAKVLAVFITGYGAGMSATLGYAASINDLTLWNLLLWPVLSGMMTSLPQLGKVFAEYGNS